MLSQEDFRSLSGREVVGVDGDKIGTVDALYADREDGHPTFVTVSTGLFGAKTHFIPLTEARIEGDRLLVPYDKGLVKDAPAIDPDGEISPAEEERLYQHYSLGTGTGFETTAGYGTTGTDYGTATGETAAPAYEGGAGYEPDTRRADDAMTRSEERLNVGKERVEAGRARLRKYIVTENVTQTVPVRREEVRVEREPITEANRGDALSGPELTESEHEVTLHEERPVVEKETVPVERVRLGKEAVTDEQQVDETVRKEQIDTEGVYPEETRTRTEERRS